MITTVSFSLRQQLINIINKNNNVNYTISDISDIKFSLYRISIWIYNNRFDIKYDIISSIESK